MSESLLKKISVKGVFGDFVPVTKDRILVRIWGRTHEKELCNTQFGDSVRFKGVFKAANAETGEIFRAGELFLPGIAESLLSGALDGAGANAVEFAFDIGVKQDKTVAVGYIYTVKPVVKMEEDQGMMALEEKMGKLALATPKAK